MGKAGMSDEDRAELAAFLDAFAYWRKPYRVMRADGSAWVQLPFYAADQVIWRALNGRRDISMSLCETTNFFCFDIDTPGKGRESEIAGDAVEEEDDEEPAEPPEEQGRREERNRLMEALLGEEATTEPDMPALPAELSFQRGTLSERRAQSEAQMERAYRALVECFTAEPSLVVRSPHGLHAYWCLSERVAWPRLQPLLAAVRATWERKRDAEGFGRELEILPTPTIPLRIPRWDRILQSADLEPQARPASAEAFWRSLERHDLEGLIKGEALEEGKTRRPGQGHQVRGRAVGTPQVGEGLIASEDEIMQLHPRSRAEAEELLMPFRPGQTNSQLIKLIEGGKREGLGLEEVTQWILNLETRSRQAGYQGDLFSNERHLRDRIEDLFSGSSATGAGATRFLRLWNEQNAGYPRDQELAERLLGQLEVIATQVPRARPALLRLLADLDVWRRIIDAAATDPASGLDRHTRACHERGSYPLPHNLVHRLHSRHDRIFPLLQAAGIVEEDMGLGRYVPDLGWPQYYRLWTERGAGTVRKDDVSK